MQRPSLLTPSDHKTRDLFRGFRGSLTQSDIRAGDYLLLSTDIAVRREPFRPGNTTGLGEAFLLAVARAEPLQLTLRGDNYLTLTEGQFLLLKARGSQAMPIVGSGAMAATAVNALLGNQEPPADLGVLAFRLLTVCQQSGCRDLRPRPLR